jgi:hypothetical protein
VVHGVQWSGSRSLRGVGGLLGIGDQLQRQLLQRVQDKRARSLQVEETHVEEEFNEVLDHGLDLAHRRRRCDLFELFFQCWTCLYMINRHPCYVLF